MKKVLMSVVSVVAVIVVFSMFNMTAHALDTVDRLVPNYEMLPDGTARVLPCGTDYNPSHGWPVNYVCNNNIISNGYLFPRANEEGINWWYISEIGDDAFKNNQHIKETGMGDIRKIGARAYKGCKNIYSAHLGGIDIGKGAFAKSGLSIFELDEKTVFHGNVFKGCTNNMIAYIGEDTPDDTVKMIKSRLKKAGFKGELQLCKVTYHWDCKYTEDRKDVIKYQKRFVNMGWVIRKIPIK